MFVLDAIRRYAAEGRTALINREETLSYAELDRRSDAFAAWLLDRFGDDRTPVVLYGHKETNLLPCIYGSLKAGRAYVPVDITVPAERAVQICEDVQPKAAVDFRAVGLLADCVLSPEALDEVFRDYDGRPVNPSFRAKDTPPNGFLSRFTSATYCTRSKQVSAWKGSSGKWDCSPPE